MSAEVKVAIKADNQIRTGLQQALADVKKFGGEASRAGSVRGGVGGAMGPDGRDVRKTLKGLGADLAGVSTPAQALEVVANRVADAFGKVTSVVGGFAVGRIIAGQFEKVTTEIAAANAAARAFSDSFEEAASADSFSGAVSGFNKLQGEIDKVGAAIRAVRTDWGAWLADMATGGQATATMRDLREAMQNAQSSALSMSMFTQARNAEQLAAVAGDSSAEDAIKKQQQRDQERQAIDDLISSGQGDAVALNNAKSDLEARFAAEDAAAARREQLKQFDEKMKAEDAAGREVYRQQEEERRRRAAELASKPVFGPGNDDASNGGWRVQAAEYERKMQGIESDRRTQIADAMESSRTAVGSLQASGLQRIGGAGMEFADSRGIVTDMKKQNDLLKKIEENTRDAKLNLK